MFCGKRQPRENKPLLPQTQRAVREKQHKILDGQASAATCKGKSLTIVGISDNGRYDTNETQGLSLAHEPIILLAHRPEYWKEYIGGSRPPLLTLSGHAHGGQFKLFGIGIYSPNQGFFPKYYDGLYACGDKYMAVSRGLGNSIFPCACITDTICPSLNYIYDARPLIAQSKLLV